MRDTGIGMTKEYLEKIYEAFSREESDERKGSARARREEPGYFSLVLTDLQMPVMTGFEEAKAIRALPNERSKVPIIAITADAFVNEKEAEREYGINGSVLKPISATALLSKIIDILR